jgi:hypothetical protein
MEEAASVHLVPGQTEKNAVAEYRTVGHARCFQSDNETERNMPLLFWMPLIIMSGLFGLTLEPAKAASRRAPTGRNSTDEK